MPEMKKYLNRDGLEEYNSLLPHSGAEMQTYVNAWLDEHPEATTTVQDGAITEPKLADKSVSLRTLADDTVHMLKGAILTGNLSGEVLTADDAYSAPPVSLTVEGKSTQAGTPTPDAPVDLISVEQANIHFDNINVLLNLTQALRSMPDGTHDELSFAYLRPSTREGWAWYAVTMMQKIDRIHFDSANTITAASSGHKILNKTLQALYESTYTSYYKNNYVSNRFVGTTRAANYMLVGEGAYNGGSTHRAYICVDENVIPDLATGNTWLENNPTYIYLKLLEPIATQLDPIELPFIAAPNFTIWNEPSTGLQIEYVRDSSLVIQRIEEAIADQ